MMKAPIPDLFASSPDHTTDKWYKVIRDRRDLMAAKEHFVEMWNFYYSAGLNDPHFTSEFPSRLCHRWWELEVAWFLSQKGFELKSSSYGPDLLCIKGDIKIYVEDVICEPGDPNSPDFPAELMPGPHNDGKVKVTHVDLPERERLELLRLRNSIESKVHQYHQRLEKGHIDPQIPYILALSPVMIPDMISDGDGIPAVVKAVYPVGQIYLTIDRTSQKVIDKGRTYRPTIQKSSKSDILTNIFLPLASQTIYAGISGILYSSCSFKRSDYLIAMYQSFIFLHNYISNKPLELGCFGKNMDFWIEEGDDEYHLKNNIHPI
jgi:hypothetical protein